MDYIFQNINEPRMFRSGALLLRPGWSHTPGSTEYHTTTKEVMLPLALPQD